MKWKMKQNFYKKYYSADDLKEYHDNFWQMAAKT